MAANEGFFFSLSLSNSTRPFYCFTYFVERVEACLPFLLNMITRSMGIEQNLNSNCSVRLNFVYTGPLVHGSSPIFSSMPLIVQEPESSTVKCHPLILFNLTSSLVPGGIMYRNYFGRKSIHPKMETACFVCPTRLQIASFPQMYFNGIPEIENYYQELEKEEFFTLLAQSSFTYPVEQRHSSREP